MRIRTANGVGFVRLVVALVIVLVLVMSGSAAFGQQKQSGSKKSEVVKQPIRKMQEIKIQSGEGEGKENKPTPTTPVEEPPNPFPNGPNIPVNNPFPSGPGGGSGANGGSGASPIMQERCVKCSCPGDYAGPEFPDPNCNGLHKFYYEWVYTHSYDACAQSEHTDLHICQSGRIEGWKFNATKYRFSNCSGVPDQNEPVFKQGNNATGLTHSAAGVDFPLCRQ